MAKGKKYTAAEKHFLEQKAKLDKDMKYLRQCNRELSQEVRALSEQLEGYEELKVKYEKLLEVSGLTQSELKSLLSAAKNREMFLSLMAFARGGLHGLPTAE